MKLSEIKQLFLTSLTPFFPSEEIGSFFHLLASHYLGYIRFETVINASEELTAANESHFLRALERLKQQEPIQYILGTAHFYDLELKVNKYTLIPRPESEELVQWIIDDVKRISEKPIQILDIGTGSGCIAIALAKHLDGASVSALDISSEALEVARTNAERLEVNIDCIQADILSVNTLPQQYDLIVSNPPYVRQLEKKAMNKNVLRFEPEQALYVSDEDPLLFYRTIAQLARMNIVEGGALYFEINEYLSKEMERMLKDEGYTSVALRNDMYGKPRMMKAQL